MKCTIFFDSLSILVFMLLAPNNYIDTNIRDKMFVKYPTQECTAIMPPASIQGNSFSYILLVNYILRLNEAFLNYRIVLCIQLQPS